MLAKHEVCVHDDRLRCSAGRASREGMSGAMSGYVTWRCDSVERHHDVVVSVVTCVGTRDADG